MAAERARDLALAQLQQMFVVNDALRLDRDEWKRRAQKAEAEVRLLRAL